MDKYAWTVVRPDDVDQDAVKQFFVNDVAARMPELVRSVAEVTVTIQEPEAFSSSVLSGRTVDALLEITTSDSFVALDAANEFLAGACAVVQGWRVHPTLIFDAAAALAPGAESDQLSAVNFIQRADGTTAEHFTRNWYIHAGHLDGEEAESEQSIAERKREEAEGFVKRYRQNRVSEPITATQWLIHGYTQLQFPILLPALPDEPYERVRGEADFDRWPPRLLQGYEHRVV